MDDLFAPGPDLDAMDRAELLDYLATVRAWIAGLDGEEPEDMDSEAYDDGADRHEALEDIRDEIEERLEEFGE